MTHPLSKLPVEANAMGSLLRKRLTNLQSSTICLVFLFIPEPMVAIAFAFGFYLAVSEKIQG